MLIHAFRNPWILLATEFFEGFSGYVSFVAGSYYCTSVSPPGMLASLNGIVYAAVFGLGTETQNLSCLLDKTNARNTILQVGVWERQSVAL